MYRKIALLATVTLVWCGSAAFGTIPMGPPTAVLKEGQISFGFDYGEGKTNIDFDDDVLGTPTKGTLKNMKSNSYVGRLGYGLYRYGGNWDVYALFGAAKANQDEFEGDYYMTGGFATKLTLYKEGELSWGVLYQMQFSRSSDSFTEDPSDWLAGWRFDVADLDAVANWYEIQFATGATYQMGGFRVYGGPALYYIWGDIDYHATNRMIDTDFSIAFDEKPKFGGYAGVEFNIRDNSYFYVEYQSAGDTKATGTGICWRF